MKSKLEIYGLAVCFAAVICLVIAAGIAGYSLFRIAAPKVTLGAHEYAKYQTNDAYWESLTAYRAREDKSERPLENELTKQRLEGYSLSLTSERRDGFQALIQSLMFIIAGTIALVVHWHIAKSARI